LESRLQALRELDTNAAGDDYESEREPTPVGGVVQCAGTAKKKALYSRRRLKPGTPGGRQTIGAVAQRSSPALNFAEMSGVGKSRRCRGDPSTDTEELRERSWTRSSVGQEGKGKQWRAVATELRLIPRPGQFNRTRTKPGVVDGSLRPGPNRRWGATEKTRPKNVGRDLTRASKSACQVYTGWANFQRYRVSQFVFCLGNHRRPRRATGGLNDQGAGSSMTLNADPVVTGCLSHRPNRKNRPPERP